MFGMIYADIRNQYFKLTIYVIYLITIGYEVSYIDILITMYILTFISVCQMLQHENCTT